LDGQTLHNGYREKLVEIQAIRPGAEPQQGRKNRGILSESLTEKGVE